MATTTIEQWTQQNGPSVQAIFAFNIIFAVQLLAAVIYGVVFQVSPVSLHIFLIPFLWITVSIMAVWYTDPVEATPRRKALATAVSGGFFLVFLSLSGAAGTSTELFAPLTGSSGFAVTADRSLGWAPVLFYSGEWIALRIIPYQLIGYVALSYLIYTAILRLASSAKAGLLGLALCPGCTAALFAPVFASTAGVSSAFALFVRYTYEISTVFFLLAVGLIYWEPSLNRIKSAAVTNVPAITAGVAAFVGWVHLFHPQHGIFRLIEFAQVGALLDPRPLAFTISGLAIFAGIFLAYVGIERKKLYLAGIGLMIVYILGYAMWHTALDHGAFWPYIEGHGHSDQQVIETVVGHLLNDTTALLAKIAELTLLGLLVVLYRQE